MNVFVNQLQAFEKHILQTLPNHDKIPAFRPGDTVRVHVLIKEGSKERTQMFEGVCIARRERGLGSNFRVRKLLAGVWVERQFPLYSPLIKIERVRQGVVRRGKLYYLRGLQGKAARIPERTFYHKKNAQTAIKKDTTKESSVKLAEAKDAKPKDNN